jgi:adenylate cyclase class IV
LIEIELRKQNKEKVNKMKHTIKDVYKKCGFAMSEDEPVRSYVNMLKELESKLDYLVEMRDYVSGSNNV